MSIKRVLLSLTALGAIGLASTAQAQNVEFAASTTGCFYKSPATTCTPANASNLFNGFANGGVTFHGGSFDGMTDGSTPNQLTVPGTVGMNLGWFDSGNALHVVGPNNFFNLDVFFTLPTVIGDPNAIFHAVVSGAVTKVPPNKRVGGYDITFTDSPQTFTYFGPTFQGSFTLLVNNTHINAGYSENFISGTIVTQAASLTPEPATMVLFATGLLGLVPFARRRRNQA